jgi:hypothetical protein
MFVFVCFVISLAYLVFLVLITKETLKLLGKSYGATEKVIPLLGTVLLLYGLTENIYPITIAAILIPLATFFIVLCLQTRYKTPVSVNTDKCDKKR